MIRLSTIVPLLCVLLRSPALAQAPEDGRRTDADLPPGAIARIVLANSDPPIAAAMDPRGSSVLVASESGRVELYASDGQGVGRTLARTEMRIDVLAWSRTLGPTWSEANGRVSNMTATGEVRTTARPREFSWWILSASGDGLISWRGPRKPTDERAWLPYRVPEGVMPIETGLPIAYDEQWGVVAVPALGGVFLRAVGRPGLVPVEASVSGGSKAMVRMGGAGRWVTCLRDHARSVNVVESSTGTRWMWLSHSRAITAVGFTQEGRFLIVGDDDGVVHVNDLISGEGVASHRAHSAEVTAIAASGDGSRLVTTGKDGVAVVWDADRLTTIEAPGWGACDVSICWLQLGDARKEIARLGMVRLVAAGDAIVDDLSKRVVPALSDHPTVARLVRDLDSETCEVRELAMSGLAGFGLAAEPALRGALSSSSAEVRERARIILQGLEWPLLTPSAVRALRAVCVLEWIGSESALRVLRSLAEGDPAGRLTCEARHAVGRIEARRP